MPLTPCKRNLKGMRLHAKRYAAVKKATNKHRN